MPENTKKSIISGYYDPEIETIDLVYIQRAAVASLCDKEIFVRIEDLSKEQLYEILDIVNRKRIK